jgi:hypothetical protein
MAKEWTIVGYGTKPNGTRDPKQAIYGWVDGGLSSEEEAAIHNNYTKPGTSAVTTKTSGGGNVVSRSSGTTHSTKDSLKNTVVHHHTPTPDKGNPDKKDTGGKDSGKDSGSGKGSGGGAGTKFEAGQNQYEYGASIEGKYDATDKDFQKYLLNNPDLREHAEGLGLYGEQAADWGRWHWDTFGQHNDARINTPFEIKDPGLKGQIHQYTEIPQVYKDLGLNTLDEVFRYSLGTMTPSELWEVRSALGKEGGADWSLASFDPEGWRYEADNPYAKGLLDDTLLLNKDLPPTDHRFSGKPIGQLTDAEDLRFLQDRYNDAFIQNDFPDTWVSPDKQWTGPKGLEGYWNTMTNAYRDAAGNLRASWDRPAHGWYGFDSGVPIGPRGGGGTGVVGGGIGGAGYGVGIGGLMLDSPYTQPAPQDWSNLRHQFAGRPSSELSQFLNTPASRAMFGSRGAAMQPWATGQGVPSGLLNYQIPGGPAANVSFSGGNPGLFDFNNNNSNNNNNNNNQDFVYTHPAMNPSNQALNDWLTANPMTDGRFSTALDWNESLYDWSPFGDVRTTPDVYIDPTADTNPTPGWT